MEEQLGRIYYSRNVVNLCIDSYDAERQCGKLWSQYGGEPFLFSSLYEALERMERLYDTLQYPHASTETRSFRNDGIQTGGVVMETDSTKKQCRTADRHRPSGIPADEWKSTRAGETFNEVIGHRGQNATFIIRVQYRQHSSWQGEIVWVDGGRRRYFESVLELIRLIDKALEGQKRTLCRQAGIRE